MACSNAIHNPAAGSKLKPDVNVPVADKTTTTAMTTTSTTTTTTIAPKVYTSRKDVQVAGSKLKPDVNVPVADKTTTTAMTTTSTTTTTTIAPKVYTSRKDVQVAGSKLKPDVNVPVADKTTTTAMTTTSTTTTTTIAPKVYTSRKDVQARYTRSPTPCQSGEWAYSNQTGNCYLFFRDRVSQDEAIEVCNEKNANLLSIENQNEQNFVDIALSFDFYDHWTRGRKNKFGDFTYNGTKITYENWLADNLLTKPKDGEQVCIALVKIYYREFFQLKWKWDRKPCGEKKSFVCQHTAKRCPPLPMVDFVEPHPPKPFIELTIKYTCQPGYEMPNYTLRYHEWLSEEPGTYDSQYMYIHSLFLSPWRSATTTLE
ncbi:uncharacterized protein LOC135498344 [Lineus longissimus]|uniref:uncharacterized protein LOC135498344 n=1 Tax=Lineus longissimus TaxID=88925 RepID=UPI00315CE400